MQGEYNYPQNTHSSNEKYLSKDCVNVYDWPVQGFIEY